MTGYVFQRQVSPLGRSRRERPQNQLSDVVKETRRRSRPAEITNRIDERRVLAREAGAQDRELALKQAEGRRAGHRQRCHQEHGRAHRHGMEQAARSLLQRIVASCCWTLPAQKNSSGLVTE